MLKSRIMDTIANYSGPYSGPLLEQATSTPLSFKGYPGMLRFVAREHTPAYPLGPEP